MYQSTPWIMQIQNCIIDNKGAGFIGNKQTNKQTYTHTLNFVY